MFKYVPYQVGLENITALCIPCMYLSETSDFIDLEIDGHKYYFIKPDNPHPAFDEKFNGEGYLGDGKYVSGCHGYFELKHICYQSNHNFHCAIKSYDDLIKINNDWVYVYYFDIKTHKNDMLKSMSEYEESVFYCEIFF